MKRTINSVIEHNINISNYNSWAYSSYLKLPKELDYPGKGLINIQNIDDNECFKCCLIRYLDPAYCNPIRIAKTEKYFSKRLGFKDIIRDGHKVRDVHKMEKRILLTLFFW